MEFEEMMYGRTAPQFFEEKTEELLSGCQFDSTTVIENILGKRQ